MQLSISSPKQRVRTLFAIHAWVSALAGFIAFVAPGQWGVFFTDGSSGDVHETDAKITRHSDVKLAGNIAHFVIRHPSPTLPLPPLCIPLHIPPTCTDTASNGDPKQAPEPNSPSPSPP